MKVQTEETQIAVISNDIGYIKKSVEKIDSTLGEMRNLYAPKADVDEIKKDVENLKQWKWWILGVMAAVGFASSWAKDYFFGIHH